MARLARIVMPGFPHHVVQRGVRSLPVFEKDADKNLYLTLLKKAAARWGVDFWAWCVMSNHVHLVAVPRTSVGLARALAETHRRFSMTVNRRTGVRGHLFQERFHSFPVHDDTYLLTVARYVELNPVRAGVVRVPEKYAWSSARHHLENKEDPLVTSSPILEMLPDWRGFLKAAMKEESEEVEQIRHRTSTGRLYGPENWARRAEAKMGRALLPEKRGWRRGRKRPGK